MARAALLVIDLLEVIVARECVGSYDPEHEALTLRYLDGKIALVLDNAQVGRRLQIGTRA